MDVDAIRALTHRPLGSGPTTPVDKESDGEVPAAKTTTRRRRDRPSPRQRLLKAATRLFTTEGIRVIGIDRILREADVAKASLYSLFGSKDNLVIACLEQLDEQWRSVSYTHLTLPTSDLV